MLKQSIFKNTILNFEITSKDKRNGKSTSTNEYIIFCYSQGVISVNEHTIKENCSSSKGNDVLSIIMMAEKAGLSTGVVTTTRVTHATPATAYSHSASRDWENDVEAKEDCKDIGITLYDLKTY